jgi:hypothetical protein
VSLVAKNRYNLAARPALAGKWAEALVAFDSDRQVNSRGVDTPADTIVGLGELLVGCGVEPVAWYGVRLFTDGRGRAGLQAPGGDHLEPAGSRYSPTFPLTCESNSTRSVELWS